MLQKHRSAHPRETHLRGILPEEIGGKLHYFLILRGSFGNFEAGGGELDGDEAVEGFAIDLGDSTVGCNSCIAPTILALDIPALGRGILLGLGHDWFVVTVVVLCSVGWFGWWFGFMSRIFCSLAATLLLEFCFDFASFQDIGSKRVRIFRGSESSSGEREECTWLVSKLAWFN